MAVDMFLKLPAVGGESLDSDHKGEIDILSFSWGMTQSGTMHTGQGGGGGKVNVNDLSIVKFIDKSSPNIMQKICKGEHYDEAMLTIRKAGGKPVEYLKIKMYKVMITNVSMGAAGSEDRLTETIGLSFAKFDHFYTPQGNDGSAEAEIMTVFDIEQNTDA